jgi:hypothetical protein
MKRVFLRTFHFDQSFVTNATVAVSAIPIKRRMTMNSLNLTKRAALGRCFLALISVFALEQNLSAKPMVYTGLVVTDVRVGSTMMHNASLTITFEGDTDDIMQIPPPSQHCGGTGYFFYIGKGVAHVQIEYQGRTHTARLNDGQVFVGLDTCNGGIGFGYFTSSGAEPAYPLAFTLGTAESASINEPSPLATISSMTGNAWSCIGFPPNGSGALSGTPSGNCIPPISHDSSYPLKSDIGDIFVYQPYYEYDGPGTTSLAGHNHSGSTNRGAFLVRSKAHGTNLATLGAHAPGVVYTLQTVADGSIGGHTFNQALVTFQMTGETKSVTSQPSPLVAGGTLYENRTGYATVTVDDGGKIIVAEFVPGEVYVRYDTGAGVAGFGSRISPNYPIALNCSNSAYPSYSNYTVDCLQGEDWNYVTYDDVSNLFKGGTLAQLSHPVTPSAGVLALPQSLSQNTLLTGTAHTCAGVYTIDLTNPGAYFPGDLSVCGGPAPSGLHTSKGDLFLQDLEGGSLWANDYSGIAVGWDIANSGFLHVEVLKGDN